MSEDWFNSNKDLSFDLESLDSIEEALKLESWEETKAPKRKEHKVAEIFKKSS